MNLYHEPVDEHCIKNMRKVGRGFSFYIKQSQPDNAGNQNGEKIGGFRLMRNLTED